MFWLMRLVHMGIQRAIVTNKKQKKKGKRLKTPPQNSLSNDQVSDFRSHFLSFLHFLEEHPRGFLCARFTDAEMSFNSPCLCDTELGSQTWIRSRWDFLLAVSEKCILLISHNGVTWSCCCSLTDEKCWGWFKRFFPFTMPLENKMWNKRHSSLIKADCCSCVQAAAVLQTLQWTLKPHGI